LKSPTVAWNDIKEILVVAQWLALMYIQCSYEGKEEGMATTQIAKWGNSLGLRIPKALAEEAQLQAGEPVTLTVARAGDLVIRRARRKYRLSQLVSRITAENRHAAIDWGEPQGKEAW